MSELSKFEALVRQARHEVPPSVDVADRVTVSLRTAAVQTEVVRTASSVDRMAVLFAAASVLAASIVAMITWQMTEQPMMADVPNPFVVQVFSSR